MTKNRIHGFIDDMQERITELLKVEATHFIKKPEESKESYEAALAELEECWTIAISPDDYLCKVLLLEHLGKVCTYLSSASLRSTVENDVWWARCLAAEVGTFIQDLQDSSIEERRYK